jgi:DnaB-like helicase N terminal domain
MWSSVEAEQALLGAVLADPPGQQYLLDLVEPGDMFRPWHGQVLAAMQRLRGHGQLPSAQNVYQEIQHDPDLPRSVALDAAPLAGLLGKSPRTAHAGTYAAIVVETGIRRRIQLAGSRVTQAAEDGDLDAALGQATRTRADLVACAARWTALPPRLRSEPARLPAGEPRRTRPPVPGAVSGAQLPAPEARAASGAAVRDLIDDPGQLAAVRSWLRPEHFTHAASGRLYAVLLDMDASGQPIDPITVAWAAGRRGLLADPARLAGGTGPFAVASAREVWRLGLLARITSAGIAIQRDAADPHLAPSALILTSARRLDPIRNGPLRQPGPAGALAVPRPSRPVAGLAECEPEAAR